MSTHGIMPEGNYRDLATQIERLAFDIKVRTGERDVHSERAERLLVENERLRAALREMTSYRDKAAQISEGLVDDLIRTDATSARLATALREIGEITAQGDNADDAYTIAYAADLARAALKD